MEKRLLRADALALFVVVDFVVVVEGAFVVVVVVGEVFELVLVVEEVFVVVVVTFSTRFSRGNFRRLTPLF